MGTKAATDKKTIHFLVIDLFNERKFINEYKGLKDPRINAAMIVIAYGYDDHDQRKDQFSRDVGCTFTDVNEAFQTVRSLKADTLKRLIKKHFVLARREVIFLTRFIEEMDDDGHRRCNNLRKEYCKDWFTDENIYRKKWVMDDLEVKLRKMKKKLPVTDPIQDEKVVQFKQAG